MGQINLKAAGLSCGIVWSALIFFSGICSMAFNWGTKFVELFETIYPGYHATFWGSIVGGLWAFVDGGIGGVLFAWLYNRFSRK